MARDKAGKVILDKRWLESGDSNSFYLNILRASDEKEIDTL